MATIGENTAYGPPNGKAYMVSLYIDEGLPSRGHRANMLNPKFKVTGMHACDHNSKMQGMIVALYAGGMVPNDEVAKSCPAISVVFRPKTTFLTKNNSLQELLGR